MPLRPIIGAVASLSLAVAANLTPTLANAATISFDCEGIPGIAGKSAILPIHVDFDPAAGTVTYRQFQFDDKWSENMTGSAVVINDTAVSWSGSDPGYTDTDNYVLDRQTHQATVTKLDTDGNRFVDGKWNCRP